jgi:hypothetical protein
MPLQYRKTLTVSAANTTAVAAAQTRVGAGNLTLASATVTLPNGGQRPSLTSTGNLSAVTFTFTGTDRAGNPMSMSMAGPNNNTVVLPATMATITQLASSGTVGTNTSAGYAARADLNPLPLDLRSSPTDVSLTIQGFTGAGTPAATVRFTQDNVQKFDGSYNLGSVVWFNHATLVAQTAAATGNFDKPVVACSLFLDGNDQAASVDFIVLQGTTGVS